MTFDEIMESIVSLAENDQSIDDVAMTGWIRDAINRINVALGATFPSSFDGTDKPAFDERYHEALIIFGVAKYRESDADFNSASYFMQQFNDMLIVMQRDMVVPPSYKNDYNYKQIVITDVTVMVYNLNIPSGSYFDEIEVYQNDVLVTPSYYRINQRLGTITFTGLTLTEGDYITVKFENNSDLNNPPYQWWGTSGW